MGGPAAATVGLLLLLAHLVLELELVEHHLAPAAVSREGSRHEVGADAPYICHLIYISPSFFTDILPAELRELDFLGFLNSIQLSD